MVDFNSPTGAFEKAESEKRMSPIDVMGTVVKWRRFILSVFLVVTLLSVGVSFLLPKWYASRTSIMPPRSRNLLSSLGSISSLQREIPALRSLTGSLGSEEVYRYLAILKSRDALEMVVRKFNLVEVYDMKDKSVAKAADALEDNATFKLGEEGTISITVYDQDSQRAAAMANYFVEVVNQIGTDLNVQEARSNREFLEKRARQNEEDLKTAEGRLKSFQKEYGFYAMPQVEYSRFYRELAVQQKIFEFIVPLYEQAKYEESRNAAPAVVLDIAQVPDEPARPRKRIIVAIFALLSLISSISIALFVERVRSLRTSNPDEYTKLENVRSDLRTIWPFRKKN